MEQIYGGQLRLSIKTSDKGERRSSLMVCAELYNTNGSTFRKELVIRLTDENDPFFHYQLKLNDEDYQSLRVQQGLLVDFLSFPQRFADLLELCRKEEMNEYPKFLLNFVTSGADGVGHLNVIETNPFKHLVHLSLRLVAGSDSDVKKHLAQRLTALSGQNEKLRADLRSTESDLGQRLHETRISLSARQSEVENLKRELCEQAAILQAKWEQQLVRERDKAAEAYRELQSRCNKELNDCRVEHEMTVSQLRNNLAVAEARALDLGERRQGSESVMHDLRSQINVLEDELAVARRTLNELHKEKKLMIADRDDAQSRLTRLSSNTAALEQGVRTSESAAVQLRSLLDNAREQNVKAQSKVTSEVERLQSLLTKRETSLKTLAEEVNKGNEIIRKLQAEIKNLHSKLKVRNKVVEEQEKAVNGKEVVLEEMQRNLNSCRDELKLRTEEAKKLQENLDAAQTKLDESAKLARTNENVINWLNKQLNELQLAHPRASGAPPFGSPFVTSTPADQAVSSAILQYQPKLASVQVASKRPPFDAIPEDPNSPRVGKENNAPSVGIDPKYLQPSRNNQRPRYTATNNTEPSAAAATVRLPRMSVAPPSARWPATKSSAYFPS